jgi:hypothetical protein
MTPSPAQVYAGVVGPILLVAGIIGFFASSAFGAPGRVEDVFDLLSVNGWHDLVHLVTGLAGLVCVGRARAARGYAGALGAVYLAVAIWGFALGSGESILGFLPVNTADNVLHAALGALGLVAWLASHEPAPTASKLV